jgi:uncharacterized protein YihD (DUF1040 family)
MSRDPGRIDLTLRLLRDVWKANPDWRLGQLVQNAADEGARMRVDVFHVDDDEVCAGLDSLLKQQPFIDDVRRGIAADDMRRLSGDNEGD